MKILELLAGEVRSFRSKFLFLGQFFKNEFALKFGRCTNTDTTFCALHKLWRLETRGTILCRRRICSNRVIRRVCTKYFAPFLADFRLSHTITYKNKESLKRVKDAEQVLKYQSCFFDGECSKRPRETKKNKNCKASATPLPYVITFTHTSGIVCRRKTPQH